MANIEPGKYLQLGVTVPHTATSYEIYKGQLGDIVNSIKIDSIYNSKEFKDKWWSKLPNPDGGFFSDEDDLFCRIKIHFGDETESEWFTIGLVSQVDYNKSKEVITEYKTTKYET